ncbi:hypothetical protein J6590_060146 [Homalodisca vitripennis]|nr:hypothetical protein J6590_060146 [Homalodisca vitripennis]
MVCPKCSKRFSNPTEIANCVECKAEYHPGCCCIRTATKLKVFVTSVAGWKCEDCHQGSTSIEANMESVAKALKLTFDISIAHRLPAPRNRHFHPAIVVQFARRSVRGEWLAATKTRFHATDLHETFSVNEHLTLHTKDLLWRCMTRVKAGSLAYAWCKDGKVYVCHTKKSRAIRVFCSIEEIDREQSPGHGK